MSMIPDSTELYGGPQVQLFFTNRNFPLQIITFFYKSQLLSTNHSFFIESQLFFTILHIFFKILLFFLKSCNFFLQILQFNIVTLSQLCY